MTSRRAPGTGGRPSFERLSADSPFVRPTFDIRPHRHLYPFRSNWLRRDGMVLHYLDEGSGEPLVLVHGNPTWSLFFRALIPVLAPRYRLVAPDHLGCGLSSRPRAREFDYSAEAHVDNLEDLLDHLGLEANVTLVLHDWGGVIGMACACRRPERISRIVLLNTAAFLMPAGKRLPWPLRFIKTTPFLPELLVLGLNAFSLGATHMATSQGMPKDVRRAYTAPYNSWHNRIATLRFVRDIPVTPRDSSYGLVSRLGRQLSAFHETPMLICWGERDFVFDRTILEEWRRRFPAAAVHTFPDAGHYLLEDAPEPVIDRITGFLKRHPL